jgi:LruC domain-containing protein
MKKLKINLSKYFLFIGLIAGSHTLVFGQTAITNIFTETSSTPEGTSYNATGAPNSSWSSTNLSYRYGSNSTYNDNQVSLLSLQAGNASYRYEGIDVEVYFRRVDNPNVSGERDLMFYFGNRSGTTINLKAPYEDKMKTAFEGNTNLLRGSDNLFANTGDGNGNINNIERMDVVINSGLALLSASAQGFSIMERGGINQHDSFVVAVITAIDGAGNPTAYSNLLRLNSTNYGNINVIPNQTSVVLRRDNNVGELKGSTNLSGQGIGGVFFSFADFGLTDGETVYGYSVAGADFPSSGGPAEFIDYTNADYFPLNTSGNGAGGIDMIALTGIVRIIAISGNAFNDINGLTDNDVNGDLINQTDGNMLYVNLVNNSGIVLQSVAVEADGSYSFPSVPLGDLKLELSTLQGTPGNSAPNRVLPANWVYTGVLPGSGSSPIANVGQASITITADDIHNINFGIQQLPLAGTATLSLQNNPGGNTFAPIPADAFSGSDFDGGTITEIKITTYPVGANGLKIDGTTYTSASFPAGGVSIPANANGEPQQSIDIDPVDGDIEVVINYVTIDNAGFESAEPGTVTVPFSGEIITIENFYPATGYGTLAFEDLWPAKGDYDFNDLVIDYQFEIVTNTSNLVESVTGTFIIQAFGASYENGFGFQLSENIDQDDIEVSGYSFTEDYISLTDKGIEAGQSRPTIIVFDNAYGQMTHPGVGIGVNTETNAPYVEPVTLVIEISFKPNTYSYNDLDISNFNPFLIVDKQRGVEVHLPHYPPTDLVDVNRFGEWDDDSNPAMGRYYVSENELPWAIHIYERFDYPIEKQQIVLAHLKFADWAISGGQAFPDWYKDLNGYRNNSLIYQIPGN